MSKERLQGNIKAAKAMLTAAETELAAFIAAPENNVFDSVDMASAVLEDRLSDMAHADCEGAGNRGLDEYKQEFIVDGLHYIATYKPEYNRHDKTYYYVEDATFTVAQK